MKKLSTSIKISFVCFILSAKLLAGPVGFVRVLKGNAFSLLSGKMKVLAAGDTIEDFSEIYTEEGSEIVLADYHDHSFHLAGSGHIKMIKGMMELQKGYLWIKSIGIQKETEPIFILTANAQVQFNRGEGVVSYDYSIEKTQVLSVLGKMSIENAKQNYQREDIPEGHFSFVSKKYNEGAPRIATPIGGDSFKKVVSLFDLPRAEGPEVKILASRSLASKDLMKPVADSEEFHVPPAAEGTKGKGKIKIMRTQTHQYQNLQGDYLAELKREKYRRIMAKKALEPLKKSGVKVMMYGFDKNMMAEPAKKPLDKKVMVKPEKTFSVQNAVIEVNKVAPDRIPASQEEKPVENTVDSSFEDSLKAKYKSQPKHGSDIGKLINELQNFDQDYSPEH